MIRTIKIKIWLWWAIKVLGFTHIVAKVDDQEEYIEAVTFSYDGEYTKRLIKNMEKNKGRE